ncbi:hypothetical protein BpHYR1_045110 [Brachionus plicatilis]|uniref:Uncharacterized protein n=1 Tax=Brachionus plicatilis TaxID=10195 RepID=A0A3M7SXX2_BRAPC|nr:hypothetical protein BpHYR1_045110 [Brachionus plicatilis]
MIFCKDKLFELIINFKMPKITIFFNSVGTLLIQNIQRTELRHTSDFNSPLIEESHSLTRVPIIILIAKPLKQLKKISNNLNNSVIQEQAQTFSSKKSDKQKNRVPAYTKKENDKSNLNICTVRKNNFVSYSRVDLSPNSSSSSSSSSNKNCSID